MIKDIVVNLNVGAEAKWASDYAISVAAALDAHLTGVIFLYGPIVPVSRAGYVPPELEVIERHTGPRGPFIVAGQEQKERRYPHSGFRQSPLCGQTQPSDVAEVSLG